eukprot:m.60198 g.60198  ORF g.60198 m.60198 type:complete len:641 (-) comp11802_c0_seq3:4810-6732(-)
MSVRGTFWAGSESDSESNASQTRDSEVDDGSDWSDCDSDTEANTILCEAGNETQSAPALDVRRDTSVAASESVAASVPSFKPNPSTIPDDYDDDMSALLTDLGRSIHSLSRQIDRNQITLRNRFLSIEYDSHFVKALQASYPELPLVANMRCGAWYFPHFDEYVHFKSADGHRGQWKLSLKRLNFHLLPLLRDAGGCVLVDSTRKGRTLPDSYSRTIPIWCCCINRVIRAVVLERNLVHPAAADTWCTDLIVPSTTVPPQEKDQILSLIDDRVTSLKDSGIDLGHLVSTIQTPLRPVWTTTETTIGCSCNPTETAGLAHSNHQCDSPKSALPQGYINLVCACVSEPVDTKPCGDFTYIQGAGDDEETWSLGLTPQLFWQHKQQLCDCKADTAIQKIIAKVVRSKHDEILLADHIQSLEQYQHAAEFSKLGETGLFLGNFAAFAPPFSLSRFDAFVCCAAEGIQHVHAAMARHSIADDRVLLLNIPAGKRHKHEFEESWPRLAAFVDNHLSAHHQILFFGRQGTDRAATTIMAVLTAFQFLPHQTPMLLHSEACCQCTHSQVEAVPPVISPTSVPIPSFESTNLPPARESCCACGNPHTVSKRTFPPLSSWLRTFSPTAWPSRHNMKKLHCIFIPHVSATT